MVLAGEGEAAEPDVSRERSGFDCVLADSETQLYNLIDRVLKQIHAQHEAELKAVQCMAPKLAEEGDSPKVNGSCLMQSGKSKAFDDDARHTTRAKSVVSTPPERMSACQPEAVQLDVLSMDDDQPAWDDLDCVDHDSRRPSAPPVTLAEVWRREVSSRRMKQQATVEIGIDIFAATCYRGKGDRVAQQLACCEHALVEPSSVFNVVWRIMGVFLLAFDVLTIPMMAFDLKDTSFMRVMMFFTLFFWTLDVPLLFFRGFVNEAGELEIRHKKIIMHYLKTYFLQDLALLVIEWVNFIHVVFQEREGNRSAAVMRVLRFMRLLKVTKANRLLNALAALFLQISSVPKVVISGMLILHFAACGWYAISGEPGDLLECYTIALRWALFGWVADQQAGLVESLYTIAIAAVSTAMLVILIGAVITEMAHKQAMLKTQRDRESGLRLFLNIHNISWGLRCRIWAFLEKLQRDPKYLSQTSVELIRALPAALTLQLKAETYIPVLTAHPFFCTYAVSGTSSYPMRLLLDSQVISEKALVVEHELFTSHGPAEHMYFLVHGRLYYRAIRRARLSGWTSARCSLNHLFANPMAHKKTVAARSIAQVITSLFRLSPGSRPSMFADAMRNDASKVETVYPGDWLCEAALWLNWHHAGIAAAQTDCEVLSLEAQGFQKIMRAELPEAQRYAVLFLRYARDHQVEFTDLFADVRWLQEMAKDVFEPPLFFVIGQCRPVVDGNRSEWHPTDRKQWQVIWSSPWKEGHAFNTSALISTLTTDMKHDVILMYQTLFAQNLPGSMKVQLGPEESLLHDQRVLFLKRLVLSLAVCRLRFAPEDNGLETRPWPYPLASALCHGSRILVHLKDVSWKSFVNLLLFGEQDAWSWEDGHVPSPFYQRRAASHGMHIDHKTSQWHETKVHKLAAFNNNNLGMDLPLGGLGNTAPTPLGLHGQLYIGPSGVPFKKAWMTKGTMEYLKDVQHGHLYMRWDEAGGHCSDGSLSLSLDEESADRGSISMRNWQSQGSCSLRWSSSLECWLPQDADKEGWAEVPPVETKAELDLLLGSRLEEREAEQLYTLWVIKKELSIERSSDGRFRCRGLLVQLSIVRSDGDEEKVLVQTSATAQLDEGDRSSEDMTSMAWRIDKVCQPTCICLQHEFWKTALSRYLRNMMGLSDAAVRCLLRTCNDGEKAHLFRSGPVATICHHHTCACPSGMEAVYEVLHLKAHLQIEHHHLVEPLLAEHLITKERKGINGFGKCGLPDAEGTIIREWQWLSVRDLEKQCLTVGSPEGSCQLTLKASSNVSAVLLGIESSAPLKKDFFGHTHSVDAVSKSVSAFGKRKWRDYRHCGQQVPADLGGMHVHVDETTFRQLQQVFQLLPLAKPSDGCDATSQHKREFELFRKLLQSSDSQIGSILEECFLISRSGVLI